MKAKTMRTNETRRMLQDHFGEGTGHVTYSKGQWTVRYGYFYTHGCSEDNVEKWVLEIFPEANIVDKGNQYRAFRGGASVRASSHWWVTFTL